MKSAPVTFTLVVVFVSCISDLCCLFVDVDSVNSTKFCLADFKKKSRLRFEAMEEESKNFKESADVQKS